MRVKLSYGPADGLTFDDVKAEPGAKVSIMQRCSPPKVHYYLPRLRGTVPEQTVNGYYIYVFDVTLPR